MAYLKKDSPIPTSGKGSKLTALQQRFVDEFPLDCNGSKAVIRAGYKTTAPNRVASELLRHPLVRKELDKYLKERREHNELTADYVIQRLMDLAEAATKDGDQIRALELLGKTMSLFKERQEISGPDGEAIEYQQKTAEKAEEFTRKLQQLAKRSTTDNVVPFQKEA